MIDATCVCIRTPARLTGNQGGKTLSSIFSFFFQETIIRHYFFEWAKILAADDAY
jgi:hypothetical protein